MSPQLFAMQGYLGGAISRLVSPAELLAALAAHTPETASPDGSQGTLWLP